MHKPTPLLNFIMKQLLMIIYQEIVVEYLFSSNINMKKKTVSSVFITSFKL